MKNVLTSLLALLISSPLYSAAAASSSSLSSSSLGFKTLLKERLLESNPLQPGAVVAEGLLESFDSLLFQQPQMNQTADELATRSAEELDSKLSQYSAAKLIAAGQFLFLQGKSLGFVEILKYKLADIFIKDHSPEMILTLKSIKSLGNQANLSLQVLQQSGAILLFVEGKDSSFFDSSLINYEQLAYILDIYADIVAGKPVKLQAELEQSFSSKIWTALKSFVANHNQQIFAGLAMAGSIAATAATSGAAAPTIGVAAVAIARAASNAPGSPCCNLL